MKPKDYLTHRRHLRKAKKGKMVWGRQPEYQAEAGFGRVEMKGHATIAAKVIRADGTVEDLGVIAEGEV